VDWSALTPLSVSLLKSKLRFSTYIFIILYSTPSGFEKYMLVPLLIFFNVRSLGSLIMNSLFDIVIMIVFFFKISLENILK
jgi:hypothetical protein